MIQMLAMIIRNSGKKTKSKTMTEENKPVEVWQHFYLEHTSSNNFYPENFVIRVLKSKAPVQFINDKYYGKKILDLGCGYGRHIPFLTNCGFNVTGLEVSESQVESLKEAFPSTEFITGNANSIPVEDKYFEYLLACNSIYYLDNENMPINLHFNECARVLCAGGKIIFSMLGIKHSIFNNCTKLANHNYQINEDFLGFRNGVLIRPYLESDNYDEIFTGFIVDHHGEIIETVSGFCRHIHYFVATRS